MMMTTEEVMVCTQTKLGVVEVRKEQNPNYYYYQEEEEEDGMKKQM